MSYSALRIGFIGKSKTDFVVETQAIASELSLRESSRMALEATESPSSVRDYSEVAVLFSVQNREMSQTAEPAAAAMLSRCHQAQTCHFLDERGDQRNCRLPLTSNCLQ